MSDFRDALDPLYLRGYEAGKAYRQNGLQWRSFGIGLLLGMILITTARKLFT